MKVLDVPIFASVLDRDREWLFTRLFSDIPGYLNWPLGHTDFEAFADLADQQLPLAAA